MTGSMSVRAVDNGFIVEGTFYPGSPGADGCIPMSPNNTIYVGSPSTVFLDIDNAQSFIFREYTRVLVVENALENETEKE